MSAKETTPVSCTHTTLSGAPAARPHDPGHGREVGHGEDQRRPVVPVLGDPAAAQLQQGTDKLGPVHAGR
jgi:hypothetical protein